MHEFHVFLLPLPDAITARVPLEIDGRTVETLSVTSPSVASFPVTFEEVEAAMSELPRLFCEPDGAFVWRSSSTEEPWQLDGLLGDVAGRLVQIELKGGCSTAALEQLLGMVGWPQFQVAFQLVQAGVLLDEAQFRRLYFAQP